MESVYLKTLVEVVKTGSLSRAAEALFVTQPAVSRRIKFLEEQYGKELLDRSGPRLKPTEAGMLVYRKAEALLGIEAELAAGLDRLRGRTRIAFASSPAFGIAHLPAVLREFMLVAGDAADLSFVLQPPPRVMELIEEGGCDAAVLEMCELFDTSRFFTCPLPADEMVFVSAPGLGITTPDATLDALTEQTLYTRKEGCCSRTMLEKNLARVGREIREFRRLVVFDDIHVVVEAVLAGEGISFLSGDVLAAHLTAGRLRAHRVPGFQHGRNRALVVVRPESLDGPLARFAAGLFDHFSLPRPEPLTRALAGEHPTLELPCACGGA